MSCQFGEDTCHFFRLLKTLSMVRAIHADEMKAIYVNIAMGNVDTSIINLSPDLKLALQIHPYFITTRSLKSQTDEKQRCALHRQCEVVTITARNQPSWIEVRVIRFGNWFLIAQKIGVAKWWGFFERCIQLRSQCPETKTACRCNWNSLNGEAKPSEREDQKSQ